MGDIALDVEVPPMPKDWPSDMLIASMRVPKRVWWRLYWEAKAQRMNVEDWVVLLLQAYTHDRERAS